MVNTDTGVAVTPSNSKCVSLRLGAVLVAGAESSLLQLGSPFRYTRVEAPNPSRAQRPLVFRTRGGGRVC